MTEPYHEIAGLTLGGWDYSDQTPTRAERIAAHLTYIGDVRLDDEPWQFNYLRFYVRPADGQVLYAGDSGCSCPVPFEDTPVSDLKETTLGRVLDVVREHVGGSYGRVSEADVVKEARDLLPAMQAAGAR